MNQTSFGKDNKGVEYTLYSFTNKNNMTMVLSDLGATLVKLFVPAKDGSVKDVVLGYDTPQEYIDNTCYFGTVIGRSGNRIANGRFTINGKTYQLGINDNDNNLHSGPDGYDNRKWDVKAVDEKKNSITFSLNSPDGDQGFPGNCTLCVTYTLSEDNEIILHYEADTDADTVMNPTNHTYFNLAGHDSGKILDQTLWLAAKGFTVVHDHQAIPTGEIAPVVGTPMDFTTAKPIGRDIEADFQQMKYVGGYDHNYALREAPGERMKMAEAHSDKTGITLEAFTTCCGVQLYAGNFITPQKGKDGAFYSERDGFCLEAQFYPNAINQENFASPILKAGEHYSSTTSYRFSVQ